jgi:hypothetical protein
MPGYHHSVPAGQQYAHTSLPLLLLKRSVRESSFQQPKKDTNDRIDDELIEVDKKSRG